MDEEWGFFIDLDYPYPYPYPYPYQKQNKAKYDYNYLTTIYEEDYWYEKDETVVNEVHQPQQLQNNNQKIIPLIMYCVFCASFISLSLLL
jgi:hypothetical protein